MDETDLQHQNETDLQHRVKQRFTMSVGHCAVRVWKSEDVDPGLTVPVKPMAPAVVEDQKQDDDLQEGVEQEECFGPKISPEIYEQKCIRWNAMLEKGEGKAMASYIAQNMRIPRRGEVGLSPNEIEHFEKLGFVMSGSRHVTIDRMRKKKEELVKTSLDQRMNAIKRIEKRKQRENELMAHWRELIQQQQTSSGTE